MKVGVIGMGRMGQCVATLAHAKGHTIVPFRRGEPLTDKPDVFIDFSAADAVLAHLRELAILQRSVVIGTTGWEEKLEEAQSVVHAHKMGALYAPNFSLGIARFLQLLSRATEVFETYDVAGIDIHHAQKKDAPSGTARLITERYAIPFSSMRVGHCLGTHHVLFDSPVDCITLTHTAKSRNGFAQGAVEVAEWICDKTGWRTLDEYLHSSHHAF